jgi:uncharacterized protein
MSRGEEPDPGLPIKLHPCANGEFVPPPPSPVVLETARRMRALSEANAAAIGMSRRRFLLSSMGAAAMLTTLAACSKDKASHDRAGTPGGTFVTTTESDRDPAAAQESVGGDEFVFDVQGHFLDYSHDVGAPLPGFPQSRCGNEDPHDCYTAGMFLDLLFNKSDTNMVVLSALPFAGSPLSPEIMAHTIDAADRLCGDHRVLMQGEAHPSDGPLDAVLTNMEDLHGKYRIGAWKVYCHAGGPGWYLDDRDPRAPQVGHRFLDQATRLGPPIVAVHKGFSGGSPYASPVDVGPAAAARPNLSIVVYHSGFEADHREGPYDEAVDLGVNRLITSARRAGIKPGGNVYAELGSTWRTVMGDPTQAAHVLGKLLVQFGEDNVVWGTDSIWYGSPQDQIQAFRAFQISDEFQEKFGYPALSPKLKAKILGLNSARLYGVKPITTNCRIARTEIEQVRQSSGDANRTFGPTTAVAASALMATERIALH